MQAAVVASRETDTLKRLRESMSQPIGCGEERRLFTPALRAMCVTPRDQKSRDLQRLDQKVQNSLAASRFRSLEIHRNTAPRRVDVAPVVNHISCLQPRHFRDAEQAVEGYQQRDCSTVATKEAHHCCERMRNVQVHGSVRRGREKSVPASDHCSGAILSAA